MQASTGARPARAYHQYYHQATDEYPAPEFAHNARHQLHQLLEPAPEPPAGNAAYLEPLFQQQQQAATSFQVQLPAPEHQQLNGQQPEPQVNFDCFLDATTAATCYAPLPNQQQQQQQQQQQLEGAEHLRAPQVLSTPLYTGLADHQDASLQQCQLLNPHLLQLGLAPAEPALSAEDSTTAANKPQNLYFQEGLHLETQPGALYQSDSAAVYYEGAQQEAGQCISQFNGAAEQPPAGCATYQLIATAAPLQHHQEVAACEYQFHFQPGEQQVVCGPVGEQPTAFELAPQHLQVEAPSFATHTFDNSRFLVHQPQVDTDSSANHLHHFQEQHYHELIKQQQQQQFQPLNHHHHQPPTTYSYLESNHSLERRQTFEPSLASQEETQSSSASLSQEDEASNSGSEESASSILTRDEKKAREANIPLAYKDIINLSIEQFNEQLSKYNLSESQLNLIKDIRRRGKNKVAAQSCRKRKMEQISELQLEVEHLGARRRLLGDECNQLAETHSRLVRQYDRLYSIVQEHLAAGQHQLQHQSPAQPLLMTP